MGPVATQPQRRVKQTARKRMMGLPIPPEYYGPSAVWFKTQQFVLQGEQRREGTMIESPRTDAEIEAANIYRPSIWSGHIKCGLHHFEIQEELMEAALNHENRMYRGLQWGIFGRFPKERFDHLNHKTPLGTFLGYATGLNDARMLQYKMKLQVQGSGTHHFSKQGEIMRLDGKEPKGVNMNSFFNGSQGFEARRSVAKAVQQILKQNLKIFKINMEGMQRKDEDLQNILAPVMVADDYLYATSRFPNSTALARRPAIQKSEAVNVLFDRTSEGEGKLEINMYGIMSPMEVEYRHRNLYERMNDVFCFDDDEQSSRLRGENKLARKISKRGGVPDIKRVGYQEEYDEDGYRKYYGLFVMIEAKYTRGEDGRRLGEPILGFELGSGYNGRNWRREESYLFHEVRGGMNQFLQSYEYSHIVHAHGVLGIRILLHPDYNKQRDQRRRFMTGEQRVRDDEMFSTAICNSIWLPELLRGAGATLLPTAIQEHSMAEVPDVIQEGAASGSENIQLTHRQARQASSNNINQSLANTPHSDTSVARMPEDSISNRSGGGLEERGKRKRDNS